MRKIIIYVLSLVMVFAPAFAANASTSVGGWTALDTVVAGANTTINAVKGAGSTAVKSAITIAPQAGKVGKSLIKGVGPAAVLMAVSQILGDGVDWVLDPANNRIKYKPVSDGSDTANNGYICKFNGTFSTAQAAGVAQCKAYSNGVLIGWAKSGSNTANGTAPNRINKTGYPVCGAGGSYGVVSVSCTVDPNAGTTNPDADGYKYISADALGSKVVSNAEAGHTPSQEAVKATALEGFAAGEHDAALDAAAVPDTGVENPTDPNNPTDPVDPAAPFDPSSIIAAINALKALLAGILSSITGLADIFNDDPPPEKSQSETDVPVDVPPEVKNATEFDVDYIGFSSQCPTLQPFSVGIGGASSTMTFDMTPLCNLAVTIRPAIIAIAYFIGLGVIASAIRET